MKLFTIGHSNHSIDKFIRLLQDNGVDLLVDVRTAPYGRYNSSSSATAIATPSRQVTSLMWLITISTSCGAVMKTTG
jgi:uncharacterized protein (DUF488 family)